ncbi:MAG TPA: hypothetical protein PKW95_00320 [bacterium]|nr:hypothetical protein [bacterium]
MGRIGDLKRMVKERRVGFVMDEVMTGDHEFEPEFGEPGRRPMSFRSTWGPRRLSEWLNPLGDKFLWQELTGAITVDGLCENAPATGSLELKYFTEHILRYKLNFSVDGTAYEFVGEKVNIRPWNLPVSHTTCYGVLTEVETGRLVSKSVTHFRLKTAPAFLASFRFA